MFYREIIYCLLSYGLTAILLHQGLQLLRSRNAGFKLQYTNDKNTLGSSEVRLKSLEEKLVQLNSQVSGIVLLFEITRDISKTLEEADALTFLKIKLKQFIDFDDCFLVDPLDQNKFAQRSYYYLPLIIEGKVFSYLAIKDLNIKNLTIDHLYIISNQFALVLKKIRLYHKLQELAITDDLTHTFSRRYLMERFGEEYNRSTKFKHKLSLLMLDIDHFKACNDKFGHLVGDIVLASVADEIKKNIRQVDLAGRFGGEEFAVILPEADKPGAANTAERIRSSIANRLIQAYDETIAATVSIGVATYPDDAKKPEELIDRADWSLYRAKQSGRNRVSIYGIFK
jgi:diguanylate cyclase (GGDEF)-like protein